jgi:hypothetical protein
MRFAHPSTMTADEIFNLRAAFVGFETREGMRRQDMAGGVVFLSESDDRFNATGFSGKAIKPAFHLYFRTEERRDAYVAEWVRGIEAKATAREVRAQERKNETHGFVKGSILYASWGYEQTNIDWYEVIAVVSDKTVVIQKIAASVVSDGDMTGKSMPAPGHFIGEPMRKRATRNGVSLTSFSSASAWDGKPKRYSSYA